MNTGSAVTAGPFFVTDDPPANINPLLASLTSDVPAQIRATDPVSAAMEGFGSWYGQPATIPGFPGGSASGETPWYSRIGVIVLAILLIALGVWVVVK